MKLAKYSAFARPEAHLTRRTVHGAIVTLAGAVLAATLLCHEVAYFLSPAARSRMEVDLRRHHDLQVYMDITFHAVPCAALSFDVIDASGTADSDVNGARGAHLHKIRLSPSGARVDSAGAGGKHAKSAKGAAAEYHTPQSQTTAERGGGAVVSVDLGAAMQQMADMEQEMAAHEGCRLTGDATVRRVAGRLHFAAHQSSFVDVLPQMLTGHVLPRVRNMSHTVHRLAFGPGFPGQVNPLDGTVRVEPAESRGHAYKYYLKVVPTEFTGRAGAPLESNSYAVSEYALPLADPAAPITGAAKRFDPFVDFVYDLSPIVMRIDAAPLSLPHFLVRLCAVVGGAVSVTKLADGLVHGAARALGLFGGGGGGGGAGGGARGSMGGSGGGGGGSSCGGFAGDGALLPTRSSGAAGGPLPSWGSSGALPPTGRASGQGGGSGGGGGGNIFGSLAAATSTALRHSGGGGGGFMLPTHSSSGGGGGGGAAALSMAPLSGFAPPALAGFGSWSQVDGGPPPLKKL